MIFNFERPLRRPLSVQQLDVLTVIRISEIASRRGQRYCSVDRLSEVDSGCTGSNAPYQHACVRGFHPHGFFQYFGADLILTDQYKPCNPLRDPVVFL